VERVSWIAGRPPERPVRARVRIRYRDPGAAAEVEPLAGGAARVHFDEPARAVTPGQAAVFYDGDAVLGGGWIAGPLA
jgi:tRNA-specific 2-thiouridylase